MTLGLRPYSVLTSRAAMYDQADTFRSGRDVDAALAEFGGDEAAAALDRSTEILQRRV